MSNNLMDRVVLFTRFLGRSYRGELDGLAIFAKSNMQHAYYRHGHDIAIPLPMKVNLANLQGIPSLERKYFATFKVCDA